MLNTDSIVNKRIKVFVYIPENNGAGFLNGTGFVVFAYTFLTTGRWMDGWMDVWMGGWIDWQAGRQAGRQADRQTDRQTDRHYLQRLLLSM